MRVIGFLDLRMSDDDDSLEGFDEEDEDESVTVKDKEPTVFSLGGT